MSPQGWFNHYDDPDEFWDDEPLMPVVKSRPSTAGASAAPPLAPQPLQPALDAATDPASSPRIGSMFASMELDRGLLPTRVVFRPGWSRYVAPNEIGDELMAAYRGALVEHRNNVYSAALSSGRLPTPQEMSDTATPSRRTRLILLLETETWDQYCAVSSSMVGGGRYDVHGRIVVATQHPVSVIADRRYLRSIRVWGHWAARAHPDDIGDEILACAEHIRTQRPNFIVQRDWSIYSDADLEYHLDRHRDRLFENEVL